MVDVNYSWINTYSGEKLDINAPDAENINIEDIAHALSRVCRYGGHCEPFYSVAQHCVLVSLILDSTPYAFEGLMHDAAEAYIGDIVAPLKTLLPEYLEIEHRFERVIANKFGLEFDGTQWPKAVKAADWTALFAEKKAMLPNAGVWSHPDDLYEIDTTVVAIPTDAAERLFLMRFNQLNKRLETKWIH